MEHNELKFFRKSIFIFFINPAFSHFVCNIQEIFFLWYYCSSICCWYIFHNVKFEFPMFSFSWFYRPIKDCLFLRLKTEMCWAIKDKWIKGLTFYLFKVWLFEKKILFLEKNLKVDNYLYCIKPNQDKIKTSNIVEKI